MRILVVTNRYPPDTKGGYESRCSEAVDALRRRGHDVLVLTSTPRSSFLRSTEHVRRELSLADMCDTPYLAEAAPIARRLLEAESNFVCSSNVYAVTRVLDDWCPDVAYLFDVTGLGGLAVLACLSHMSVPIVWHLLDAGPVTVCSLGSDVVRPLAAEFERQIHGPFIASSQQLVHFISSQGITLNGPTTVLPEWVATDGLPDRTYFAGDHLRVVAAGPLDAALGSGALLEAAAIVRDHGYGNFSVDLRGDTVDALPQALIHKFRLEDLVTLESAAPGFDYRSYDITFPLPVPIRGAFPDGSLQAAAHGCVPLVALESGAAEWLVDGVHCLKTVTTPGAIAARLIDVLDEKFPLGPLARRAATTVQKDFHIDSIVGPLEDCLLAAVKGKRHQPRSGEEAYHLAVIAEKLMVVLLQERA